MVIGQANIIYTTLLMVPSFQLKYESLSSLRIRLSRDLVENESTKSLWLIFG